jgi:hypothetical protein
MSWIFLYQLYEQELGTYFDKYGFWEYYLMDFKSLTSINVSLVSLINN